MNIFADLQFTYFKAEKLEQLDAFSGHKKTAPIGARFDRVLEKRFLSAAANSGETQHDYSQHYGVCGWFRDCCKNGSFTEAKNVTINYDCRIGDR